MPQNPMVIGEGGGKTLLDYITFSGACPFSSLDDIPSQRSLSISASITVIPQLPEGRIGRVVSYYSLSPNLSTPTSGGTTDESMDDSR